MHTTDRLRLRPIERSDILNLERLWANPQVMRHLGFPRGLRLDERSAEGVLSRAVVGTPEGLRRCHMVVERKNGTFLGEALLVAPDSGGVAEPDLKLLPEHWGHGYGTEILGWLLAETFHRYPDCDRVRFTPNVQNQAAMRLYLSAGCAVVGRGYAPPAMVPDPGFVGVSFLVVEITRQGWYASHGRARPQGPGP